jgi:hypothetical protein
MLLKYKARHCNTPELIETALAYYSNLLADETLGRHDRHNVVQSIEALKLKQIKVPVVTEEPFVEIEEIIAFNKDRLVCYYKAIELIPQMLERSNTFETSYHRQLLSCFIGALQATGNDWRRSDYSQHANFQNCGSTKEKIVFLLHEVITSGFHHPKQILKQLNLYLKLVRIMGCEPYAPFRIPDTRREVTVEIQDFKY